MPLELYEARNAVQIARWTGAEQYAGDTFQKAVVGLENAEGYLIGKAGKKPIGTVAREAVQMAEDARIITVKKIEEEQLATERRAGAEREARAEGERAAALSEADRVRREAEQARLTALEQRGTGEAGERRANRGGANGSGSSEAGKRRATCRPAAETDRLKQKPIA